MIKKLSGGKEFNKFTCKITEEVDLKSSKLLIIIDYGSVPVAANVKNT